MAKERGLKFVPSAYGLWLALLLFASGSVVFGARAGASGGSVIRLRYAKFDPLAGEPWIATPDRIQSLETSTTYLLQFSGPVQEAWKDAVQQAGVRLYGYIPDYAFITRMEAGALPVVQALPFVRWVGEYYPAYRLATPLRQIRALQTIDVTRIVLQTLPDADLDRIAVQAQGFGALIESRTANSYAGYFRMDLPVSRLLEVAALDGVVWVEPYQQPELTNDIAVSGLLRAQELRASLGLYGNGQVIAVADTGLDTGSLVGLHPDIAPGRVVVTDCLGRPSPCEWSDYRHHGTHVIGTALGSGLTSGSDPAAHQYTGSFAGVAPEASLVLQSIADRYGSLSGIPADVGDLLRSAAMDGARIHSNSWGSSTHGVYDSQSQQVDQALWELGNVLAVFSAGNDGTDLNLDGVVDPGGVGSPGTAKNVLTIGATENNRPVITTPWDSAPCNKYALPICTDREADDPQGMAAFSSRGPTHDGRLKPNLVAPGTYIASMRSQQFVLLDDMEGDLSGYLTSTLVGGTSEWQLLNDTPHSPVNYWNQTLSGAFPTGAITFLLTPPIDVRPTSGSFDVNFWHKYSISAGDKLVIYAFDADLPLNYAQVYQITSGSQSDYALRRALVNLNSTLGYVPTSLRLGFGIQSDGSSNSTWSLDDLRVDGADWGSLSTYGVTTPGSAIDLAYVFLGGTSMAAPQAAGSAALAREWLNTSRGIPDPSAAALIALLVNGAADLSPGQYGTGATQEIPSQVPNPVLGWGRIDLVESLAPPWPRQVWVQDNTGGPSTGLSSTYTVTVGWVGTNPRLPPVQPLRISLAWTDYPAELAAGGALVNDLDLEVIAPDGTHYYGNSGLYSGAPCLREGLWDACNNVESVNIPSAAGGDYRLVVHGYNVPQGGQQPFALVASGVNLAGTASPPKTVYLPAVVQ